MSYRLGVANIYELLSDDNGEAIAAVKASDQKKSEPSPTAKVQAKATTSSTSSSQQQTKPKPKPQTDRKNDRVQSNDGKGPQQKNIDHQDLKDQAVIKVKLKIASADVLVQKAQEDQEEKEEEKDEEKKRTNLMMDLEVQQTREFLTGNPELEEVVKTTRKVVLERVTGELSLMIVLLKKKEQRKKKLKNPKLRQKRLRLNRTLKRRKPLKSSKKKSNPILMKSSKPWMST